LLNQDLPLDFVAGDDQAANGMALLALGRFDDALAELRLVAALGDNNPSTLLNLAIAEDRVGDRDRARRLMQMVAVRLPDWDEPILRLAESFRAGNETAAAEEAYRHVLQLAPDRPQALIALGGLLLARGEAAQAQDLLEHCCEVAPDEAEAWDTLGLALRATGAPDFALAAFVTAQRLRPDELGSVLNGVAVTIEAGEADAELARLEIACDQDPLNHVPQTGRGSLLERLGRRSEAIDALEIATVLAPDALVPLGLLGGVLARSSRLLEADAVLRRIRALQPDNAQARSDHAVVLMRLHLHAEARAILLDLLEKFGPQLSVLNNLANATVCVGLQDEAVAAAHQAILLDPNAMLPRRTLCNTLPYRDGTTGLELLSALRTCGGTLPRTEQPAFANTPDPDRKLVVGLLSGSLRSHPVGWLTVAGIETLDPERFSIVCLAENTSLTDPIARRYRTVAKQWIEIDTVPDAALTTTARAHGVDILIDLGGYGDNARMAACANRLAPVQIKWVGNQNHSTGFPEMDWFLTDRWETPPGFEALYSERLLRLPDGYVCYSPPPHAPDVVRLPALTNGYITFGCFNNLAKITPRVIATWSIILQRIPTAQLVLKTYQFSDRPTADRILADFAAHGIGANRIELRGVSPHRAFMGQYGDIDIVLDPFPYSGGLTTCEALWMGVPTITLAGEIFAARHSTSHLSNAGLAGWVTDRVDDYIEMAVARAADIPALAVLRDSLRERVRLSPLCDAPRFGRNLGAALRHTWREWCSAAG
jgi:predicted O-linked N-acetylglucosamine transferase (SPINDLY family)/Tfp pilus assembly protein PilF